MHERVGKTQAARLKQGVSHPHMTVHLVGGERRRWFECSPLEESADALLLLMMMMPLTRLHQHPIQMHHHLHTWVHSSTR